MPVSAAGGLPASVCVPGSSLPAPRLTDKGPHLHEGAPTRARRLTTWAMPEGVIWPRDALPSHMAGSPARAWVPRVRM